jgi:DNA-binding response OmpR family regulator
VETSAPTILILEDEEDLRTGLTFALEQEGYGVATAATVAEASRLVGSRRFDLLILDVMLPDGSGFDFCKSVRAGGAATQRDVPIVFLTAKDDEIDVVRGLETGGDDYVSKPFRLRELLSRVKARLRRTGRDVTGASLVVDPRSAVVLKRGRAVQLTASEYRLLLALFEHPGQVLSRDQLADRLLGLDDAAVDDNTVSVYIRRLREKLEDDPSHPCHIVTVRGLGYRYEEGS